MRLYLVEVLVLDVLALEVLFTVGLEFEYHALVLYFEVGVLPEQLKIQRRRTILFVSGL